MNLDISAVMINLDHRVDRWDSAKKSFDELGYPTDFVKRFPAIRELKFGGLGCAKSHALVLAEQLFKNQSKYIMILEDDFRFNLTSDEFSERFNQLINSKVNWNVLVLNGTMVKLTTQKIMSFSKLFECHSAAGYIVRRDYAINLIKIFLDSVEYMSKYKDIENKTMRSYLHSKFAIDVLWKSLQWKDTWLIGDPSFGKTEPSISDVEGFFMDQNNITFKSAEI
jgi:glycosyl transferase family 25